MNELNSGMFDLASLMMTATFGIVGLTAWFFINRASSRTQTQIALLEDLLEQQKRQTALLRRLCDAHVSQNTSISRKAYNDDVAAIDDRPEDGLHMVAER